jgi:subtilisin family serine protease
MILASTPISTSIPRRPKTPSAAVPLRRCPTRPRIRRIPLVLLWLLALVPPVAAQPSKLDPLARIALQRLKAGESVQVLRAEGRLSVSAARELDVFVVGDVTRQQLEAEGARVRTAVPGVYTAWVPVDRIDAVAAIAGVSRIEGAEIDQTENDLGSASTGATIFRGPGPAFGGLNGAGVIVGNVDTGVDYHHDDFKDALGNTRILRIWDQTNPAGPAPSGFAYGTEWNSAQINGLVSTAGDTHGHGSHTMGTAAGDGSATAPGSAPAFTYAGMAPMADIIAVDGSTTGSFSRTQMADGVAYIFQQATALGKNAVVNVSIGSQTGPKDGTDPFEQTVDALSGPGKVVVISAGNDRGQALHAEWFPGNPSPTMSIGTSGSSRFVVIRGYYEASEQLNVTITTPNSTVIGPVALGGQSGSYPGPSTANGNVYIENGVSLTATGDKLVYIELNATTAAAINGTWTFTFTPIVVGAAGGEIDLFRTATSSGGTYNFVVGNQPGEEIINAIATGTQSIAAGAYVTRQSWLDCAGGGASFGQPAVGNIATFSSPGPTRDGRIKPDVAGPGTAIASVRSGDTFASCATPDADLPGLKHTLNQGTSMSAPHVTGAVALLFQKYGALAPAQVQTLLHSRAVVDGFVTAFGAVPNKDFGWGKLNLGDMTDPVCAVTSPNGGESLTIGAGTSLTWNASDPYLGVTGVDVELSRDNGGSWSTLATGIANSGTLAWTVTGPATPQARLRVTARDAAGNAGSDLSDAVWTIVDPLVGVGEQAPAIRDFGLTLTSSNPTSGLATLEYAVPWASEVRVSVYDLQGRELAVLANGARTPGLYQAIWNGEGERGPAHAGVYFVRLNAPGVVRSCRIVLAH